MIKSSFILLLLFTANAAGADAERPVSAAAPFTDHIQPLIAKYCVSCHGGGTEKPKGDFRIENLSPLFADEAGRERWATVLERIEDGEMPPKGKPRPSAKEAQQITQWIEERLKAAATLRKAEGRAIVRRLNRTEYENTMRDLLGVQVDLKDLLPPDSKSNGFDNVGSALHTSSFLLEKYFEAADKALNLAIANLPQPPVVSKRYLIKDERLFKVATESFFRPLDDGGLALFTSANWHSVVLGQHYPPHRGRYRFRLNVSGIQSAGKPVVFRIEAGPMLMGTTSRLVSYFDAPADKPTTIEFTIHQEARDHIRIHPYGLATAQHVNKIGADKYDGPGLAVHWIEVEGPLHDAWPPASHKQLFGDLPQVPVQSYHHHNRVEVASKQPEDDAERILRRFARRAFRRPVSDADIKPHLDLVKAKLAEKRSFEQAVRVGLMAIMVSPDFLFLREKPGKLSDFALASRLSYFLWSTMPDEELLKLAEQNKLGNPGELRKQVERMLSDARAAAFTENFVGQWLDLRDIDFTEPSHLYPEFDHMLKVSMVRETELFFTELLKDDLPITNFIASDFTMLNGRLAKHYGIPGVDGWEFRKVKLPESSHRGGVITMASTLKVTANGTSTSPVMRGAWVLDRILGSPPPKPPPDIPAIEPDIRGATTMRQQLAKHRDIESCAACHAKIDPPGFALESFDVIGGWRDHYRTSGNGREVIIDGKRMIYLQGPKVDPADVLPDGRRFSNIDEFKQLLLEDKDQIARAITQKLVTYATGAAPQATDRPQIDAIVRAVRAKKYGLRTLVHEIIQSELFRSK